MSSFIFEGSEKCTAIISGGWVLCFTFEQMHKLNFENRNC